MLAGHGEQFLLSAVAQLALPEARRPVGQHRRVARGVGVVLHDLSRRVADGDPVIQLARRLGHPPRAVPSQLHAAYGGVVPQEAIPSTGEQEGDVDLCVALEQFDHAALLIQSAVLVLAQPVYALVIVGLETRLDPEEIATHRLEGTRQWPGEMRQLLA